jgi:hypothetical protein
MPTERQTELQAIEQAIEELSRDELAAVVGGSTSAELVADDAEVASTAAPGVRPPPWVPQGPR